MVNGLLHVWGFAVQLLGIATDSIGIPVNCYALVPEQARETFPQPAGVGGTNGVFLLYSADADLHKPVLWSRFWLFWHGSTLGPTANRRGGPGNGHCFRGGLVEKISVWSPGVAVAQPDIWQVSTNPVTHPFTMGSVCSGRHHRFKMSGGRVPHSRHGRLPDFLCFFRIIFLNTFRAYAVSENRF